MKTCPSCPEFINDDERTCRHCAPSKDLRQTPRFSFASTVMFENYMAGTCHDGRMVDYSRSGMRFETSQAPTVGAEIFIGMDKSPYSAAHDVFRATVVWFRELPLKQSSYPYSVGVKYC
jgi:hypothetical protein